MQFSQARALSLTPICPIFCLPQALLQYVSSSSCVSAFLIISRPSLPQSCFIRITTRLYYNDSFLTSLLSYSLTSSCSHLHSLTCPLYPYFRLSSASLRYVTHSSCVFPFQSFSLLSVGHICSPTSLRPFITAPALPQSFPFFSLANISFTFFRYFFLPHCIFFAGWV